MPRSLTSRLRTSIAAVLFVSAASAAFGQTAADVAVVINENSPASIRIAEHYVRVRRIPASNVIRIKASTAENIGRPEYVRNIESPIAEALTRHALQDRILYIVLTKGVPLRITGSEGRTGTTASVDSELTLLYRRLSDCRPLPFEGPVDNPYYLGARPVRDAKPFTRSAYDIFLVTRLDGFTVEDVLALIDRSVAPSRDGAIVLDQRAQANASVGDGWMAEAARNIKALAPDRAVLLEESREPARPTGDVLGYYSWGSTDPALRRRPLGLRFGAGSIAAMLTSTDARTFASPPDGWRPAEPENRTTWFAGSSQSLVGDLVREGVTGAAGNVSEPYLQSAVRPRILFPAYLSGFNLAESFYLSLPHLSWQTIVIGDPLCRPFGRDTVPIGEVESAVDATTGLPSLFLARRLKSLTGETPGAPRDAFVLLLVAETRLARGDRAGAKKTLEKAISLAPKYATFQVQLAILHDQDGESADAVQLYRRAIEVQPGHVIALNNLAFALARRPDGLTEARALARTAYALAPKSGMVLDTLGWIEHALGNDAEAATLLRAASLRDPDHPEIRLHAATVLLAIGAKGEASAHLKAAVSLDPSFETRDDVRQLRTLLAGA